MSKKFDTRRDGSPLTEWLGTCTTASTTQQKSLTFADIVERVAQSLRDMPPEPIGEWMRQQGCPPDKWCLILPQRLRDEVGGPMFWPDYVAFSPVLDQPVIVPRPRQAYEMLTS